MKVLSKHASQKKKIVRGNQIPFMTKDLSKEIMKKSRLRSRFLKDKSLENRMLYTQQRNYCASLLGKTKIRYYANLNEKKILDNKQFWKVVKPLFSDKSISGDKINLTENGEYVKTKIKTAEMFNNFFSNIVKNLKIPQYSNFDPIAQNIEDPTLKAIVKYKNHPSILTIQAKYKGKNKFSFTEVTTQDIEKEIFDLETRKASQISDIPTKIIKENVDVFADFLCTSINSSIKSSLFPSCLKFADVTPLHKKGRKDAKQNYRPVSILPTLSKIYERSMFKQMSSFFEVIFSKHQCAFRKSFSIQQYL